MHNGWRFDAQEMQDLQEHGFVLRRDVFGGAEVAAIRDACEELVHRLVDLERRAKHSVGSYTFEIQHTLGTVVKWEPDALEMVQGVELFAHLSERLRNWGLDARFLDPSKDVTGAGRTFTRVRRAQHGDCCWKRAGHIGEQIVA